MNETSVKCTVLSVTRQWKIVNKGTTQGSVSGPYLFNLFLNDPSAKKFKFAVDPTLLVTIPRLGLPDRSA